MTDDFRTWPLDKLALHLAARRHPDATRILRQAEGWQRLRTKVPTWAATEGLEYPPRLALEQCSGEAAARYKAGVVARLFPAGGDSMADLTGGLGVDFSFVARHFSHARYVERQEELCRLARHNFPLLGLPQAEVTCADGTQLLPGMEPVDLLFLDPARRDGAGRKTVALADCEPDVTALCPLLLAKARYTVVKLSPMLDISQAVASLQGVAEVHVVATGGECKDLLLVLSAAAGPEPQVWACQDGACLRFTPAEEAAATPQYAERPEAYVYEPGAAVLKAGAFRLTAVRYGLRKLHPNSHLYTGPERVADFPGRTFRLRHTYTFGKADLRLLRSRLTQANVTVRNFPGSVDALRKRLKLRDGGAAYLFATTLRDGTHALLETEKPD